MTGHFILEMEQVTPRSQSLLQKRLLPERATALGSPLFKLTGLAIGNGLTDPATQVSDPYKACCSALLELEQTECTGEARHMCRIPPNLAAVAIAEHVNLDTALRLCKQRTITLQGW